MSTRQPSDPARDTWPVRTPRLEIRRCTAEDIDAMWEWRRHPEVSQWLDVAPATRDALRAHLLTHDQLASLFIIDLLPEHEGGSAIPIGDIMVRLCDSRGQHEAAEDAKGLEAELEWALDPAHEGDGYGIEAVRAVIDVCFGPLGMRRVHAGCFADDEHSWHLMERLGMRREELSRKSALHRSGRWLDRMSYGILAEEWPVIEMAPGSIPEDIETCVSLWTEALSHRDGTGDLPGAADRMRKLFDGPVARFTLAGQPLAGFALAVPKAGDAGTVVLERIAVQPAAAGHGIGRTLLADTIAWSKATTARSIMPRAAVLTGQ